ncbi:MAG: family 20 glycosylhydrolase [Lewinellaceae bacterium]|nr:family 20 glycosylhydrolase [Lewinellaceae bacterium]
MYTAPTTPDSYRLLEDVLDEVLELFPPDTSTSEETRSVKATGTLRPLPAPDGTERQYAGLDDIQSHFVNHFDNYLRARGRRLIGWHEILKGNSAPKLRSCTGAGRTGAGSPAT